MQGDPQAELPLREVEALLEGRNVRPDVVHDVLVVDVLVLEDQQVVLAEHTRRHPTEHGAHFGARHSRRDEVGRAGQQLLLEPIGERPEHPLKGGDVGADPIVAIHDAGSGQTRLRRPTRVGLDQRLRLSCQFLEVAVDRCVPRGEVGCAAPSDAARYPFSRGPIDSGGHGFDCYFRGYRERVTLKK